MAAEEPSNNLPSSASFPTDYFLLPNKSIITTATPNHFQSVLLLPPLSAALFDSQEYWKVLRFFLEPGNLQSSRKLNSLQNF